MQLLRDMIRCMLLNGAVASYALNGARQSQALLADGFRATAFYAP